MGFNTAITGLKASARQLDVTGSNIANASTVGFKGARTEFADIFTSSVAGPGSSNAAGAGVIVSDIAQNFTAGTVEFTNNNMDLAIDGDGFFQLKGAQGGVTYTRAGSFELDRDGNVIAKNGKVVQGYGIDAAGNQLPVANLAITQKESDPQATEAIALSFNIDSRLEPPARQNYDKDDAGSYSFTTTSRIFDPLGNEHTIKLDFVEQGPFREQQTFTLSDVPAAVAPATNRVIDVNGVAIPLDDAGETAASIAAKVVGSPAVVGPPAIAAVPGAFTADERVASVKVDPLDASKVVVTFKASATDVESVAFVDTDASGVSVSARTSSNLNANEIQALTITAPEKDGQIRIGSGSGAVLVDVNTPEDDVSAVLNKIIAREDDILALNPNLESLLVDRNTGKMSFIFKSEADPASISLMSVGEDAGVGVFSVTAATQEVPGDNSYLGVYRTYGYLNGTSLLNIGREPAPGYGDSNRIGPIIMRFDTSSGLLLEVRGEDVSRGGAAPKINILGADPTDPNRAISLDLSGSTQFASSNIVKGSTQDGFAKGDLIGVSFEFDGTMMASYSNGQRAALGQVALATFENNQGLRSSGDTEWTVSLESGEATLNAPGTGLNGRLRQSVLEQSNVDLSEELVTLIEAQRNFQANSKTLQTENAVTQTILQIQ